MPSKPLPEYERPPVVEALLGVEFAPLPALQAPHFGVYWSQIRSDYPKFETQPALTSAVENFDKPVGRRRVLEINLAEIGERYWLKSQDETRLLQLQNNRLLWNWRNNETGKPYPRYELTLRPQFEIEWDRFTKFLTVEGIGHPALIQCEVTYVNHIEVGDGWNSVADWRNIFTFFGVTREPEFLPSPETSHIKSQFVIALEQGRLHVDVNRAVRFSDQKELIVFQLTARGKPNTPDIAGALAWFDLGREWVVRGFTDLTSDAMHKRWGRIQ